MNDLIEIYRRIEYLRNNGLKMKEIADYVDMAPSVLSALYSSVLPTYVTSLKSNSLILAKLPNRRFFDTLLTCAKAKSNESSSECPCFNKEEENNE